MSFWWVPMAISAAGSLLQASSSSEQNDSRQVWNRYNADMQRQVDLGNIESQLALADINWGIAQTNAGMAFAAADVTQKMGDIRADMATNYALYNASVLYHVANYNDSLLAQEASRVSEDLNLDLGMIQMYRARERGEIRAEQGASGVVMDQDSAADVIIDARTQEALDAFIVRHQADRRAADISNARARGQWEAAMEAQKVMYEGQLSAFGGRLDAFSQATNQRLSGMGMLAQGAGQQAGAQISALAQQQSSDYRYKSNQMASQIDYEQNDTTRKNSLIQGLFGAASAGASLYYMQKPTNPTV